MAANEPKVTKLKPGEGAGNFVKEGSRNAWGKERTDNPCILKDGSVDPQCRKVYQRSVAGRETLEDLIKKEEAKGVSERDIFMKAVNQMMNREKGYVGAYLDQNNPGRRYTKNQAMKIVDAVMTKHGVGEHPGARLTPESDESKDSRRQTREENKRGGKSFEPGRKAMPIRQQRRMPGGRGPGLGPAPKDDKTEREVEPLKLSSTQEAINAIKGMSDEEKKAYLEEKLEGAKETQAKRKIDSKSPRTGGRTPEALPLPGSGAASARDILAQTLSQIDQVVNTPEEQRDPEKLQEISDTISRGRWSTPSKKFTQLINDYKKGKATLEDLREGVDSVLKSGDYNPVSGRISERKAASKTVGSPQKKGPGDISGRVGEELKKGGLGSKLETSKEDWLKDDDEEDLESVPKEQSDVEEPLEAGKDKWTAPEKDDEESSVSTVKSPDGFDVGRSVVSDWVKTQDDYRAGLSSMFRRAVNSEVDFTYKNLFKGKIGDPGEKKRIEKEIYSDPEYVNDIINNVIEEYNKKDPKTKKEGFDAFARDHLNGLVSRVSRGGQPAQERSTQPSPPSTATAPEETSAPVEPSPWEGEPSRRIDPTQIEEEPARAPAALPPARSPRPVTSKGGFKAPAQARRSRGGGGFTPSPKIVQDVRKAAKESATLEDFKASLYNSLPPSLFGGMGVETGPGPLEEPEPDPYSRFRGTPAPKGLGAQEAGREPATAGRGKEGQQTFFKTKGGQMTGELRGDLTKRAKAPSPAPKPPAEKVSQVPLRLGGDATQKKMQQQQSVTGRREERMTKRIEKDSSASSKKKNFNWVPDPNDPTKGEWVRKTKGRKPGPPVQGELPFNTGEMMSYEEFAQSVRSMMR